MSGSDHSLEIVISAVIFNEVSSLRGDQRSIGTNRWPLQTSPVEQARCLLRAPA